MMNFFSNCKLGVLILDIARSWEPLFVRIVYFTYLVISKNDLEVGYVIAFGHVMPFATIDHTLHLSNTTCVNKKMC